MRRSVNGDWPDGFWGGARHAERGSEIEIADNWTACGGAKALRSPNSSTLARTAAASTRPQQLDSK